MSRVLADTSALLALVVAEDRFHGKAARSFEALRRQDTRLLVTSYVLVEVYSLLDRRIGRSSVRRFRESLGPLLEVVWIRPDQHEMALDLMESREGRGLSLVDATSVVVARELRIERMFALDEDFRAAGFELV